VWGGELNGSNTSIRGAEAEGAREVAVCYDNVPQLDYQSCRTQRRSPGGRYQGPKAAISFDVRKPISNSRNAARIRDLVLHSAEP